MSLTACYILAATVLFNKIFKVSKRLAKHEVVVNFECQQHVQVKKTDYDFFKNVFKTSSIKISPVNYPRFQ